MPVYDHRCQRCGKITEAICGYDKETITCECGGTARRILSLGRGPNLGNEDSLDYANFTDVIDHNSTDPIDVMARKDPTKRNRKIWMEHHGLLELETGERTRPPEPDMSKVRKYMLEQAVRRRRIEIG